MVKKTESSDKSTTKSVDLYDKKTNVETNVETNKTNVETNVETNKTNVETNLGQKKTNKTNQDSPKGVSSGTTNDLSETNVVPDKPKTKAKTKKTKKTNVKTNVETKEVPVLKPQTKVKDSFVFWAGVAAGLTGIGFVLWKIYAMKNAKKAQIQELEDLEANYADILQTQENLDTVMNGQTPEVNDGQ